MIPLHVRLPRAHRRAGVVGADERRDDQGRAVRPRAGARRVGRRPACVVRRARARRGRAVGARRRRLRALPHDLKRLLALHSIENVGIIVLGIGACLVLRARGAEDWAAFALAAALLHTLNHAIFKALLPRRRRVRARRRLARDRPARRAAAANAVVGRRIPGRGHGDRGPAAAERVRVRVAHAPGAAARSDGGRRRRRPGRSRSRCSPRRGGARRLLLWSRSSDSFCSARRGLPPLPPRWKPARAAGTAPPLAGACVLLGLAPGLLFGSLVGVAPWASAVPTQVGLDLPTTGSLPTAAIALALVALTAAPRSFAGAGARRLPPPGLRPARGAGSRPDERGFT